MGRRRSRHELAALLRSDPPAAPVDDAFFGVLADLAAASGPPTQGGTAVRTTRLGVRVAAGAAAVVLLGVGGAYAAGKITSDDPKPTAPTDLVTPQDDPSETPETDEPTPTVAPTPEDTESQEPGDDVSESADDQGGDDQGENADDQGEDQSGDQSEDQSTGSGDTGTSDNSGDSSNDSSSDSGDGGSSGSDGGDG